MTYWCKVDDCWRPAASREWCHKHHRRWLRTGSPLGHDLGFLWLRFRRRVNLVHTEDQLRLALTEPFPFYARKSS